MTAEETFFIGIKDSNQWNLWQVQSFTQEIDTHKDIIDTRTKVINNLDTVKAGYITMDISRTDIVIQQVFGQLLCHSFGQCRHQNTLFLLCTDNDFVHQVVNLILRWAHLYLWIEQTSRTNKLFNDNTFWFSQLEVSWSSRHIDNLMN